MPVVYEMRLSVLYFSSSRLTTGEYTEIRMRLLSYDEMYDRGLFFFPIRASVKLEFLLRHEKPHNKMG